jgi:hypothetical protein
MATTPRKRRAKGKAASAPRKRKSAAPKQAAKAPASAKRSTRKAAARKPTAYERRIAKYLADHPGATLQEARGHKAREHVTRAERLEQRIEAFAEAQAYRGERHGARDADEIADAIRERIKDEGGRTDWFRALELRIRALHEAYADNNHESLGINLVAEAEAWDWPDSELFYH